MDQEHNNIVWQGKSWQLRVANRLLADGSQSEMAYIDHPGSVVIVPWQETDAGPEILMLSQYRHAIGGTVLELPAGTRGWDEDSLVCAHRELREETGFGAEQLVSLGEFWPAPGVTNEVMALYLAAGLYPDPLPQDADEEIEVVPYRFDELFTMAVDGRLHDAKSVVGILRTAVHLQLPPFYG